MVNKHFEYMCDVAVDNIQILIRNSTGRMNFRYKSNKSDFGSFALFFKWYQERYRKVEMTEGFLREYMNKTFEFYMYRNEVAVNGLNKMRLNWFFGAKSIKRWEESLFEKVVYDSSQNRQDDLLLRREQGNTSIDFSIVDPTEEAEKQRLRNTDAGLDWCFSETFLHHPLSPTCEGCRFALECESLQINHYPKIWKIRHYDDRSAATK